MGPAAAGWFGFCVVAGFAVITILLAGRSASFYSDEWWYILSRSLGDPSTWFPAHDEHWVTLHVIAYRLLYETFGTASYLPYLLALMVCHVAAGAALFVLVRRVAAGWAPVGAAAIFLLLGTGYYNLFWGFQIGMVGAMALGLWALVALPARPWLACLLLTAAVATNGAGLFASSAAVVYVALTNRRAIPLMLVPFIAFGAWWFLIGSATARTGGPLELGAVLRYPGEGLSAWVGGVAGIGSFGVVLLLATPALLYWSRDSLTSLTVAAIGALAAQAGALAVSRGVVNPPGTPHYIYMAAPFVLIVAANIRLPRPVVRPAFAWALGVNLALLVYWGAAWPIARGNPVATCERSAAGWHCNTDFSQ
jgi:hypothetical protein